MGLFAALSAMAQEQLGDYANQVPLTVSGQGPWYRLDLPLAVQLGARQADLSDVRVFNAAGEPMAYALVREPVRHQQSEHQASVKWFPLYDAAETALATPKVRIQTGPNGSLIEVQPEEELEAGEEVLRGWLLDTSAITEPLTQLSLDWSSEREGFQRFSIEASDDLQHWRSWGDGQVARLSFADERIEQHDVSLPTQPARYLRLLWQVPQSAPVLSQVLVQSSASSRVPPALVWSEPITGSSAKADEYTWTLPAALAVERVQIGLAQPNSLAPVDLFGRYDLNGSWEPLESGLLYRLTQNGQDAVQNELPMRGETLRQLKLQVDDRGGGLGAEAPVLRVAVRPVQLVFLARGAGPYRLAIGNANAIGAQLPLGTLIPDGDEQRLATLGVAEPAITPVIVAPPAPAASASNWKRFSLWLVLVVGVLALAAMAFSLVRARPSGR
ncbi:hypothetical protein PMM47T1_09221 [Pseudomonas sp. M47T1]|uniref:DUF3999 domain-containing protein n=1 Tax=unclassified Pseudomonas TaxID=196821 RepID=UPI00026085A2|nr:DUF3999 domain-containing protein [Pseudomonas sp. M47T1]EIK96828.1 hypothetical protein PMM47T1_09221 [Pseudomonas sp. M47T1]